MPSFSLDELAARLGAEVVGAGSLVIGGVRPLGDAGPEHLSFYHNRRYLQAARESQAGALLLATREGFSGRNLLVVKEPYAALAEVLTLFHPCERPAAGVHSSAVVAASARVSESASVGPHAVIGERAAIGDRAVVSAGCFVGEDARIGADTLLHPNAVVEPRCQVGARCILHAGVVIGSDGFGFATVNGEHRKVPQVGIVVVEDDVELGANVCVDRATLGETRIGRGTKVDNLVQIAHNVRIGEGSLLVAQSGISGSTELGHHVVMAGQSGAVGHLHLAERTVVTAKTGVTEDTSPGQMVSGFPSRPHREWLKAMAHLYQIEDLKRRVAELERRLAAKE